MMKVNQRIIALLVVGIGTTTAYACPVCERNQPKLLKGVVHGAGPDSQWDYLIIGVISLIVLLTLYFSVKWLIKPNENQVNHIKRMVVNETQYGTKE
ncbi:MULTISPECIES: hypothetical protein [unclassified Myroides]|uniref:hypothetical protein n=1 Tax=unclassified Myroides TaxID=2642485 RepID=UPI003D2F7A43